MRTSNNQTDKSVSQSESDTNLTGRRAAWQARVLDGATRAALAEDERYFLRQSVSTPCLNVIAKAEGIYIEERPAGGTWIPTAITCITSAGAIRA